MTGVSSVNMSYTTDALKYVNGLNVCKDTILDDVGSAFGGVPSFAGFTGVLYTGGRVINGFKTSNATNIFGKAASGIGNVWTSTRDIWSVLSSSELTNVLKQSNNIKGATSNFEAARALQGLVKSGKVSEAKNIVNAANSADDIINGVKSLTGSAAKEAGEAVVKKGLFATLKTSAKGALSSAGSWIANTGVGKWVAKNIGGISVGGKTVGSIAKSGTSWFSKAFKATGAGLNLAIEGGMALITDVIPAFKEGGFGEGIKQTAKSAAKVGASTAGFAVGATLGQKAGAFIGGAIGSAIPVIGTGIGAFVGGLLGDVVGGLIGSAVTGKVAEKIVGEDYTDKVQNEAIEQQSAAIASNASNMNELNSYVYQLIQEDMADDGKLTKDSEKMLKYLEEGAGNTSNLATLSYNSGYNTNNSLAVLASRIQAGDTSVYAVPDDVLEASSYGINALNTTSYANNYTNFGYTNPYASNNAVLNYYG